VTGKPEAAAACFQEASLICYNKPLVWLRLAECCIAVYLKKRKLLLKKDKNELVRRETGSISHKRILLAGSSVVGTSETKEEKVSNKKGSKGRERDTPSPAGSGGVGGGTSSPIGYNENKNERGVLTEKIVPLSLAHANKCLRNALLLINRHGQRDRDRTKEKDTKEPDPFIQNTQLKQVVLVNLIYVSLCLNNSVVAVRHGIELLELKDIEPHYRYLCQNYLAEAYCLLNRPNEALNCLDPNKFTDKDFHTPSDTFVDPPHALHKDPVQEENEFRASLCNNLATVYILKGDLVQAEQCVARAFSHVPSFGAALLNLIYLNLRRGDVNKALKILKTRRPSPLNPQPHPSPNLLSLNEEVMDDDSSSSFGLAFLIGDEQQDMGDESLPDESLSPRISSASPDNSLSTDEPSNMDKDKNT